MTGLSIKLFTLQGSTRDASEGEIIKELSAGLTVLGLSISVSLENFANPARSA